jgi:hypothetical protein
LALPIAGGGSFFAGREGSTLIEVTLGRTGGDLYPPSTPEMDCFRTGGVLFGDGVVFIVDGECFVGAAEARAFRTGTGFLLVSC